MADLNFNKLKRILLIFITIFFISCSTAIVISGGSGTKPKHFKYTYRPKDLGNIFSNTSFGISISKFDEMSPVEPSLYYIKNCFIKEIESNGGTIVKESRADFLIKIVVSKYTTRKFNSKTYKTYIDLQFIILDHMLERQIVNKTVSISATSEKAEESNIKAMHIAINKALMSEEFINYLHSINSNDESKIIYSLKKISQALVKDLEMQFDDEDIKLAFIGFKNDDDQKFSNIFISSFKNFLNNLHYKIYTRENLEEVYNEHYLSMSGFVDDSLLEFLKIEAVEYIITGNISNFDNEKILEIQIINVLSGEIIVSESINIT